MGLPVQISNGRPKFALQGGPLKFKAPLLFPRWSLVTAKIPVAKFREEYFRDLDKFGVEGVSDVLSDIAQVSGEKRLVLLCYERDVKDCHRGDFAIWWKQHTGEEIPELRP
nr:MAG TPA: protein of unknown function DUF488 [Caudoviricetes sp.]